ncbi:MAG: hypothetical protein J0L92_14375 [Deltaproteobacteria bacterium]|nr:hypothetical protein [Deltaproteobacteria bacterium]
MTSRRAPDFASIPGLAACVSAVLDDSSDDVRLAALELVHDLGLSVGVDRLARHLHASDGRTREASIRALLAPGATNEGVTASDGARCVFDASFSWSDARRRATWERLASGHRDALIASARAHALDTSGWVELVQYAFDDGAEDFGVMAWLLAHGAPLEEEVLRVSRPASIPQSFSIGVASRFVDDPRGYAPWRALRLLADRGHEGARIEPEIEGALRQIRGAIRDTPLLDEEASDQYRLDLERIVVGLARLAGEPG